MFEDLADTGNIPVLENTTEAIGAQMLENMHTM